jgi:hypothetical protein
MAIKTLSKVYIGSVSTFAIAFLSASVLSQPTTAEETAFFCGTSQGVPATIARTPRGEVPIIFWNSSTLSKSGDMPQKLCEEVSQKFQTYYKNGTLKYITTERKNGQLVACVAQEENGSCSGEPLFSLNSNESNPRVTLQRIFRIRVASAAPINETNSRLYINLDKYLKGEYPSLAPSTRRVPGSQSGNSPKNDRIIEMGEKGK